MAESQVNSREAKLDFDEHVLEGEKTKTPNDLTRNEIFDISSRARLVNYQILEWKLRGFKIVVELEARCYFVVIVNKVYTVESGNLPGNK